jgi:branched-chain amino acid transport system ATP-binding protein
MSATLNTPPATRAATGAATRPALELKDLRKSFGKTEIIRGVDLAVQAGERVAVIGPNGAGKSTLFNLISGRFEPQWLAPVRDQPAGFVAQLSDHQYLPQAECV